MYAGMWVEGRDCKDVKGFVLGNRNERRSKHVEYCRRKIVITTKPPKKFGNFFYPSVSHLFNSYSDDPGLSNSPEQADGTKK